MTVAIGRTIVLAFHTNGSYVIPGGDIYDTG